MNEANIQTAKKAISKILSKALTGCKNDYKYKTPQGSYIRWGLVEKDIHAVIESYLLPGTWPRNDLRRAFVAGASWWEFNSSKFTMWQSDRTFAEVEAEKRYPGGEKSKGEGE